MTKNKSKRADSMKSAAAILKIQLSEVRRAKSQGCAAFQHGRVALAALRRWLRDHPLPQANLDPVAPQGGGDMRTGAPAALLRLEASELSAYNRLEAALGRGDMDAAAVARRAWLQTAELLRKVDLQVEESQRRLQVLVPKAEIEENLRWLGRAWRACWQRLAMSLSAVLVGRECGFIRTTLTDAMDDHFLSSLASVGFTLPRWATDALADDLAHAASDSTAILTARLAVLEQVQDATLPVILARNREMWQLPADAPATSPACPEVNPAPVPLVDTPPTGAPAPVVEIGTGN